MRWIGWLLLLLVGLAWVAAEVPLHGDSPAPRCEPVWRRTVDGWEKVTWWSDEPEVVRHCPTLHPMVVALLQMFLALGALIVFSRKHRLPTRRRNHEASHGRVGRARDVKQVGMRHG